MKYYFYKLTYCGFLGMPLNRNLLLSSIKRVKELLEKLAAFMISTFSLCSFLPLGINTSCSWNVLTVILTESQQLHSGEKDTVGTESSLWVGVELGKNLWTSGRF